MVTDLFMNVISDEQLCILAKYVSRKKTCVADRTCTQTVPTASLKINRLRKEENYQEKIPHGFEVIFRLEKSSGSEFMFGDQTINIVHNPAYDRTAQMECVKEVNTGSKEKLSEDWRKTI